MTSPPFSVYVHVPFCAHKCPYCDFNTYAVTKAPEGEYVDAVRRELTQYARDARFSGRVVHTIFFGGGTPSMLSGEGIGQILQQIRESFSIAEGAEITLEANPNHAQRERLQSFARAGVNRISFGVQSFDNTQLQALGRDHSADEARQAVVTACDVGIKNVSVDCIFGVPGQTLAALKRDIEQAVSLPISHLSTYSLTIEPGTPFFQRQERGLLKLPPDAQVARMLERIPTLLATYGFDRYEISNYAKPGYESIHNQVYWKGGDYLGVGAGAHSYCAEYDQAGVIQKAERWSTLALPQSYIAATRNEATVSWRESLDRAALMFEFFYLGLRMTQGVSQSQFASRFGESIPELYTSPLRELVSEGFLVYRDNNALALTQAGVAVADSVFERLSTPSLRLGAP